MSERPYVERPDKKRASAKRQSVTARGPGEGSALREDAEEARHARGGRGPPAQIDRLDARQARLLRDGLSHSQVRVITN